MRYSCGSWCRISEVDLITSLFTHTCGALPGTAWWVCIFIVVVQLLSRIWLFATPWTAACPAFLSFPISQSLLKLMSIESVMPSNHVILCHPPCPCPLLFLLPSIFPSIRVFSSELALPIRCSKYWSFSSASVLPVNIQGWFSLGLTSLTSLQPKGFSRVFSSTTSQKYQFFATQPSCVCVFFSIELAL